MSDQVGKRVMWVGSELAAPGPGAVMIGYRLKFGVTRYMLWGTILHMSATDPDSIKVEWDNGRVTIERRKNLSIGEIALAAV